MRYTTSDGYEMIHHLQTLNAHGGGYCPEYALAGTLAGTRYTTNLYMKNEFEKFLKNNGVIGVIQFTFH
jgi:hypothetical protein